MRGLTSQQASDLLRENGKNELAQKKKKNNIAIFFGQYKDMMTVILLVCTVISVFMGEIMEALTIAVIVLLNGILGFLQEYRTEKSLEALKKLSAPVARVYRDGKLCQIPAQELVVGDVMELDTGDKLSADALLLSCTALESDESVLTGESVPVVKAQAASEDSTDNSLHQEDVVYMGCTITKGRGIAKVIATGASTQMGRIAHLLGTIENDSTPLSKKLDQMGKYIAIGCLLICAVVSTAGILRGEELFTMLITGVSLAVAAVPEGLAAIVTISLALSVSRMAKRSAIVRRLHAVEALGCAGVICSDKTGTLTQNKMTVTTLYTLREGITSMNTLPSADQLQLLQGCAICNNANLEAAAALQGDPTEVALLRAAQRYHITADRFTRVGEEPFDSVKKQMSVTVRDEHGDRFCYWKGAPDFLLDRCESALVGENIQPLSYVQRAKILAANEKMSADALRCLCVSFAKEGGSPVFIGLVGMIDPPRKEVKKAVATCRRAGIQVVMITGDHKNTAAAIAKEIGILQEGKQVLTGADLAQMPFEELCKAVPKTAVFARVSPKHKLDIVKAFQQNGQIVAMTGDGVNDAPAIKEADIGVAMGISGTDVTKEASEIILMDDNFATLVNAVSEGRGIYNNIRKFIRYLLACNIGEVLTMFLGILMGLPMILLPIQILLVNLVTDGLPAIALGLEPTDPAVMTKPPRQPNESIFSHGLGWKIILRGICIGVLTLTCFVWIYQTSHSLDTARTGAFFTLIFAQLIHVFECKSEDKGLFHIPYRNNWKLIAAAGTSLAVLLLTIYVPVLQGIFSTVALNGVQTGIALLCAAVVPLVSGRK